MFAFTQTCEKSLFNCLGPLQVLQQPPFGFGTNWSADRHPDGYKRPRCNCRADGPAGRYARASDADSRKIDGAGAADALLADDQFFGFVGQGICAYIQVLLVREQGAENDVLALPGQQSGF